MATGEGLPDELRTWVDERAVERGVDPEAVLARAILVNREVDRLAEAADDGHASVAARLDRLADVDGEVSAVADRLDALDAEVDDLVADVRERVIQVKRETDAKAPADHGHDDLRATAMQADETAMQADETAERAIEAATAAREAAGDDHDGQVSDLSERVERLDERAETLARVAVDARAELRKLQSAEAERAAADELRRSANQQGDAVAKCEDCGGTVRLGLLSRPRCPHCNAGVASVDPSRFVGKARLRTGTPPALDGGTPDVDPFEGDG
jgi:predicted Zn-ribbon and HTH transcriptional regulator